MMSVTKGSNSIKEENTVDNIDDPLEKGRLSRITKGWTAKIKEINKKYSKPRLKMTLLARAALLALRLYLIMLVIILAYKFYTLVR